jgi:protein tyrosine/serine phosphatase
LPMSSIADVTGSEAHRIDEVLDLMDDPKAQPVFVHCEHGVDRTGLVVALYRVKYQNWDIEAAHREMVAMGHNTWHQIFNHEMDDYYYAKAKEIVAHRQSSIDEVVNND